MKRSLGIKQNKYDQDCMYQYSYQMNPITVLSNWAYRGYFFTKYEYIRDKIMNKFNCYDSYGYIVENDEKSLQYQT